MFLKTYPPKTFLIFRLILLVLVCLAFVWLAKLVFYDVKRVLRNSELTATRDPEFEAFIIKYGKKYTSDEYEHRLKIFKKSLAKANFLNATSNKGYASYGRTKFSDMTQEEFRAKMLIPAFIFGGTPGVCEPVIRDCAKPRVGKSDTALCVSADENSGKRRNVNKFDFDHYKGRTDGNSTEDTPPPAWDWRKTGYVGKIRDQGVDCKACWAFSVAGVMETVLAINGVHYQDISVQELLDCSVYGHQCGGGDPARVCHAWCTMAGTWRLMPERDYPLVLKNQTCQGRCPSSGVVLTHYEVECGVSKDRLMQLVHKSPVTAAVSVINWQFYTGGVIRFHCSANDISHVVQIVGYDTRHPTLPPHFIARNSWGQDFGNEGYVYLSMETLPCGLGFQIVHLNATVVP